MSCRLLAPVALAWLLASAGGWAAPAGAVFTVHPRYTFGGINPGDAYGTSVAILGDVTSDGWLDLAAGAPFYDWSGASSTGIVFVYSGKDPTQNTGRAPLCSGLPAAGARLGERVGRLDDQNGDLVPDLFAALYSQPAASGCQEGVFRYAGASPISGLTLIDQFTTPNAGNDYQGGFAFLTVDLTAAVANEILVSEPLNPTPTVFLYSGGPAPALVTSISGPSGQGWGEQIWADLSLNLDATPDLVISAPRDTGGGSVYLRKFVAPATLAPFGPGVLPNPGAAGDRFGQAVAAWPDSLGTGSIALFVGAPAADFGGLDAGSVYLYSIDRATEAVAGPLARIDGNQLGRFGRALATDSHARAPFDPNRDGYRDLAVAEPGVLNPLDSTAYAPHIVIVSGQELLAAPTVPYVQAPAATLTGVAGSKLGFSMDIDDLNGDGEAELFAGSPGLTSDTGGQDLLVPDDGFEDNDASATATAVAGLLTYPGGTRPGTRQASLPGLVMADDDYFSFSTTALDGFDRETDITLTATFVHAWGNVDLELRTPVALVAAGTSLTDDETVSGNGLAPGSYQARVRGSGATASAWDYNRYDLAIRIDPTPGRFEIQSVSTAPTAVTQGQTGIPVSMTVANPSGSAVSVSVAGLTFTGTLPRNGEYTVTPGPLNPLSLDPGATGTFDFTVDVSPAATPEFITIDGTISGTDVYSGAPVSDSSAASPDGWTVVTPGAFTLNSVTTAPTVVVQGQTGILVVANITNAGGTPVNITGGGLTFTGTLPRNGEYTVTPAGGNPATLLAGQAADFDYTVDVSPAATPELVVIDATIQGIDTGTGQPVAGAGAVITDSWTVVTPAHPAISQVIAASSVVTQGDTGEAVTMLVRNDGGSDLLVSSADLTFTGTAPRDSEYTVLPAPGNPTVIAAGGQDILSFLVDVSPTATPELIVLDGVVTGTDAITALAVSDTGADVTDTWTVQPSCLATVCGDCNLDQVLDVLDALLAAQVDVQLIPYPSLLPQQQAQCDVDHDLDVDILDALRMAQAAALLPVTLTCC